MRDLSKRIHKKSKHHRFHLKILKFLDEKINSQKKNSPQGGEI
jgi:hypothetical protein